MLINRNSKINAPRQKRGQSTVEYIILVSAVVAVVIVFIAGNNSIFKQKINSVYNTVYSDIDERATVLQGSHNGTTGVLDNSDIPTDYDVQITQNLLK